jgi:hypothetical protein
MPEPGAGVIAYSLALTLGPVHIIGSNLKKPGGEPQLLVTMDVGSVAREPVTVTLRLPPSSNILMVRPALASPCPSNSAAGTTSKEENCLKCLAELETNSTSIGNIIVLLLPLPKNKAAWRGR